MTSDEHEAIANSLGMTLPPDDVLERCRLVADQMRALMTGLTVQEAVSVLCLIAGETISLLARHDIPIALRRTMPAIAANVAACAPGRHRWSDQITPQDLVTTKPDNAQN